MEKFTIDLDQVLNDFEYKELTDQYTTSSKSAADSTYQPSQNLGKHSINNVFHSLNEYLNTNIKVDALDSINSKPAENVESKSSSISVDTTLTPQCDLITGVFDDVGLLPLHDLNKNVMKNDDVIPKDPDRDCDLSETIIESCVPEQPMVDAQIVKTDEICTLSLEGVLVNIEENVIDTTKIESGDKTEQTADSCLNEEHTSSVDSFPELPKVKTEPDTEIVKEDFFEAEDTDETSSNVATETDVPSLETADTSVESKNISIDDLSINEEVNITKLDEEVPEKLMTKRVKEVVDKQLENCIIDDDTKNPFIAEISEDKIIKDEEIINDPNSSDSSQPNNSIYMENNISDKNYNSEMTISKHEVVAPANIVAKFDDLNLDDAEIAKLLDELEVDEELNLETIESQTHEHLITDVNKKINDDCKNCDSNEETGKDEIREQAGVQVEKPGTSLDSGKENFSSQDITSNIPEVEQLQHIESDCGSKGSQEDESSNETVEEIVSEIKEPIVVKTSEKNDRPNNEDNGENPEQSKEINESDNKRNVVNECEKPIEKESSQDSLFRPQDLRIRTEADELKRNIDLIGEPGSTPFNNVYIDKEIARVHESDSDSSTSTSPTFSDGSNTASTEEIQDENDKHKVAEQDVSKSSKKPLDTESAETNADHGGGGDSAPTEMSEESVTDPSPSKSTSTSYFTERSWLGKEAPLWIPDADAMSCLHCDSKFTVIKRRHHCRACGLVLCSKCCHLRFRLEYLDREERVCNKCHDILNRDTNSSSSSDFSPEVGNSPTHRPNPNNPSEYCSTVSPLQQVSGAPSNPPAVMVPVGVLKRKGSSKGKSNKSVMFCDGIRPGSDLTNLDNDFNYNNTKTKKSEKISAPVNKVHKNRPPIDPATDTFIPQNENSLPPFITYKDNDILYSECTNGLPTVERLKNEQLTFAIHINLFVHLKIIDMSCCINKLAWCFSTEGLINVGQDEIVILLEYLEEEATVPKDIFFHLNSVYCEAVKGSSVKELGLSLHNSSNFLGSKNHAGLVYIRPTFQCLENVIKPKDLYLIGILIHRWETPWAKLFPLRLVLRLGAEYRYYPSPIISTRNRDSVFVEVGHTIINLLADFRNFSYTLPQIRGLTIHMEDKNTTVSIPTNRYDQVVKSLNNSSDHILAFAGNFSMQADSHLVCIQDTQGNENCYSTHAINIHNKPRKITGASFIVFSGALKSSSGLTAKSNIVEDGLMIQILPEHMQQIRDNLRAMKNHTIPCGCVNAVTDETVNIIWGENDMNFNNGVISIIDGLNLSGIPSIRVHNGKNHVCANSSKVIRWTEVFIIQNVDDSPKSQDPIDVSRLSETIAKATCDALVKHVDQLVINDFMKIGLRTTLQADNVSYFAGSKGSKLPSVYMNSLDNELIPILHKITSNIGDNTIVLELIFRLLNI